jgi:hypothetical protein
MIDDLAGAAHMHALFVGTTTDRVRDFVRPMSDRSTQVVQSMSPITGGPIDNKMTSMMHYLHWVLISNDEYRRTVDTRQWLTIGASVCSKSV